MRALRAGIQVTFIIGPNFLLCLFVHDSDEPNSRFKIQCDMRLTEL